MNATEQLSCKQGSSEDVLQQRRKHYGTNAALSYEDPLHIVHGEGCYLYDAEGRQYLDCVNNVAAVGHGNPEASHKMPGQLQQPCHEFIFYKSLRSHNCE